MCKLLSNTTGFGCYLNIRWNMSGDTKKLSEQELKQLRGKPNHFYENQSSPN